MNRMIAISVTTAALLGCAGLVAHGQQQLPPAMTFFIAANPTGTANLGGLAGADQICQNAAQASGGLNFNHIWHAYLSQEQRRNTPRINARDRIGSGPWHNAKGQLIGKRYSIVYLYSKQTDTMIGVTTPTGNIGHNLLRWRARPRRTSPPTT